jgi:hypothetical protein
MKHLFSKLKLALFVRIKIMFLRICRSFKFEKIEQIANLKSQKTLGPQIANPKNATFAENPQI